MDVKVRCKDDKYTRHYKADKVLYCNNGKYRFCERYCWQLRLVLPS